LENNFSKNKFQKTNITLEFSWFYLEFLGIRKKR
jgi:hypothetical protein